MERKIKNQMLPVLKRAVGDYHKMEYEVKNRYPDDPEKNDYRINVYQLNSDGKRQDTFHPIEDVCAVAQVFNVMTYITKGYKEDHIQVSIF